MAAISETRVNMKNMGGILINPHIKENRREDNGTGCELAKKEIPTANNNVIRKAY